MRIGITDSGVGGLSVCAAVERKLSRGSAGSGVELLYLNAAQDDDYAYNSMPDRATRLKAFDEFLFSIDEKYRPDLLFIACNSLSVLYPDTRFARTAGRTVMGIVEIAGRQLADAISERPDCSVLVLATPTTVEAGTYGRLLESMGLGRDRFVEQACAGLADAISNDHSGEAARSLLRRFLPEGLSRFEKRPDDVLVLLGCTHYGYQARLIEAEMNRLAPTVRVLDPNPTAADVIVSAIPEHLRSGSPSVRFVARYAIPEKPLRSLPIYLGDSAPATLAALRAAERVPDLCGSLTHLQRTFT